VTDEELDRFFASIEDPDPDGCWQWIGPATGGPGGKTITIDPDRDYRYPIFSINGRYRIAAHVSYEAFIGEVPEDKLIWRMCGNRQCVNPDHLQPRSRKGGMRLSYVDQKTCRNGHPIDPTHRKQKPSGHWRGQCRVCNREAQRRRRERIQAGGMVWGSEATNPAAPMGPQLKAVRRRTT
jgi:hypothetical protein